MWVFPSLLCGHAEFYSLEKHSFSSFVFPAEENSSRRENHTKTSYHHSLLSHYISHWFFLLSYGNFPLTDDAWGFSRKQQRVKRHCSWATEIFAAALSNPDFTGAISTLLRDMNLARSQTSPVTYPDVAQTLT